jgi:MFS superfamily sulfate permease-like transporter
VALLFQLLPSTLSFTLLGGIESLLSAKVADSMTGRRHRSNMELVAQGIANIASGLFGGISVTGTIARTATNIRAGARSPLSGMMHALFVLLFMLLAAPLARYIPLSALAGVLLVVCWTMAEKAEFVRLTHNWRTAAVLFATFGLTLIKDLTFGIVAGCLIAAVLAAVRQGVPEEGALAAAHAPPNFQTGMPSFLALSARLSRMPVPGKCITPIGSTSTIASLRLNGAALACFVQSGLKAICGTLRLSAHLAAISSAPLGEPPCSSTMSGCLAWT